jgi:DNA-3-methyladenine glycosylase I
MPPTIELKEGTDGRLRCGWCGEDPLYVSYHDQEWGRPVHEDERLFEKICLEGFQSGLSWITILRKREGFRRAFANFDFRVLTTFGEQDVERLLQDVSIVRHRQKIASVLNNAHRAQELVAEFGSLRAFFGTWANDRPFQEILASTEDSTRMSKALKKRGWSFVGPTTAYAFMQAVGLVNDHFPGCHVAEDVARDQQRARCP